MKNTPKGIRKTHNSLCSDSMRFPHNGLFSMYEDVRRLLQMSCRYRTFQTLYYWISSKKSSFYLSIDLGLMRVRIDEVTSWSDIGTHQHLGDLGGESGILDLDPL